jgi:hypothetical protein
MVLLRGVTILRNLHHVEPELGFQVRRFVVRVSNRLAIFRTQLRILDGHRLIHRRVPVNVGGVVSERSESEGIFVGIRALPHQFANEISAAYVMREVAEFLAAEWVVTQILDDRAAVSVGVRFRDLVLGQSGVAF